MNFDPIPDQETIESNQTGKTTDVGIIAMAEALIVRMIVMGSGGPENAEITEQGLRFVRHLMANSRACRSGFVPNFKSMDSIREVARDFIRTCGNASHALQTMYQVI